MTSAVATRSGDPGSVVEVFATRPRELPCATCGRTLSAHAGETPDCTGFSRPLLPLGFAYVDELQQGDAFEFMSTRGRSSTRFAARPPYGLDPVVGLLQLESHTPDSVDDIYLIERNTIVHLAEEQV